MYWCMMCLHGYNIHMEIRLQLGVSYFVYFSSLDYVYDRLNIRCYTVVWILRKQAVDFVLL